MVQREWAVLIKVTQSGAKDVKVQYPSKYILISTERPPIPRKGENKQDIIQDVKGNGVWLLLTDVPKITIPLKGLLKFRVLCDRQATYEFIGEYELPDVKAYARNINWHAEKHITKTIDNVFMRLEKGCLVTLRVFVPSEFITTPKIKDRQKEKAVEIESSQEEKQKERAKEKGKSSEKAKPKKETQELQQPKSESKDAHKSKKENLAQESSQKKTLQGSTKPSDNGREQKENKHTTEKKTPENGNEKKERKEEKSEKKEKEEKKKAIQKPTENGKEEKKKASQKPAENGKEEKKSAKKADTGDNLASPKSEKHEVPDSASATSAKPTPSKFMFTPPMPVTKNPSTFVSSATSISVPTPAASTSTSSAASSPQKAKTKTPAPAPLPSSPSPSLTRGSSLILVPKTVDKSALRRTSSDLTAKTETFFPASSPPSPPFPRAAANEKHSSSSPSHPPPSPPPAPGYPKEADEAVTASPIRIFSIPHPKNSASKQRPAQSPSPLLDSPPGSPILASSSPIFSFAPPPSSQPTSSASSSSSSSSQKPKKALAISKVRKPSPSTTPSSASTGSLSIPAASSLSSTSPSIPVASPSRSQSLTTASPSISPASRSFIFVEGESMDLEEDGGEGKGAGKKKGEKEKEEEEEDDMIEEIVVAKKYYLDSDEEKKKPKKKKKKVEPEKKEEKEKEDEKETGATPVSSQDKPKKKRRSKVVEVIDLEELQKKRAEIGVEGENLQSVDDVVPAKKTAAKPKEKKSKESTESKKAKPDTPKKDGKKSDTKKSDGNKENEPAKAKGSESKKSAPSGKSTQSEKSENSEKPEKRKLELLDLDDDDFLDEPPIKKLKQKEKEKGKGKSEKGKAQKEKEKEKETQKKKRAKKEEKPKIQVIEDSSDDDIVFNTKDGSDEDTLFSESEDEKPSVGTKLKYSSTLQLVEDQDDDGETSDYEYSGMDLLDGDDVISATPTRAPRPATAPAAPGAPGTDGAQPTVPGAPGAGGVAPNVEDLDDLTVHSKDEAKLYSVYQPKVDAAAYCAHPANVVEAHTLASVEIPDCAYTPSLPAACFNKGGLSSLQLETVAMVGMRHSNFLSDGARAGYFIGDGTGVGKGRQIAAIIADNYLKGRKKSIWFSVTNTLYKDARRDLDDIGCGENSKNSIDLLEMPTKASTPIASKGVLFATYSTLVSKGNKGTQTRFDQIMQWCGKDFEGVIVFDEGHAAKNLNPGKQGSSQTGQKVFNLQELLPKARIVYVSATGATEPHHMGYMVRLGLWGPGTEFTDFKSFSNEITSAGVGAMEMVAMEMKGRGLYCSRYLSFEGTTFDILKHQLTTTDAEMYDKAVKVWDSILEVGLASRENRSLIWAAHQRFFLHMILAIKVSDAVSVVRTELSRGCACVIGLFSTGEALQDDKESSDGEELFSAPQQIMLNLLDKIMPSDGENDEMRQALEREIKALHLPENPLDKLIDELGGIKRVAEMTGRRNRFVRRKGKFVLEKRDSKQENLLERDRFQNGEKNVAIISDAASMGISLQSDLSCKNQKQRVHIILQLPWAADKAVQQLGRTHRSHQATAPYYKLIITDLGGEWRLASTIAARLASLGALTNADRRAAAASKSLSKFLLQPKYVIDSLRAVETELSSNPNSNALYKKFLCMECNGGASTQKTKKFLNRLLGFKIEEQRQIFDLFMNQYERQVLQAQKEGRFDDGVYDLQGDLVSGPEVLYTNPLDSKQVTERYIIAVDRGVKWKKAIQLLRDADKTKEGTVKVASGPRNGFYRHNVSGQIILVIQRLDSKHYFHVCKPHLGHQRGYMSRTDLNADYKLVNVKPARKMWEEKYENADGEGKGQRMVHQTIIVGSILPIFNKLVASLQGDKIQIVRARCDNRRLVGVHVHQDHMNVLLLNLNILEAQVRSQMKRKELIDYLVAQGIQLADIERIEILPVTSMQAYLEVDKLASYNSHGRRKRKNNAGIEQYTEHESATLKSSTDSMKGSNGIPAPAKVVVGMEQAAEDVMDYLRKREARRTQLAALIAEKNNPVLLQINKGMIDTYVNMGMGTTAQSVVDTLVHQYNTHKPRLDFLRKHLENSTTPILYEVLLEKYMSENPAGNRMDIALTLHLGKHISHVEYRQMEYLVWVP